MNLRPVRIGKNLPIPPTNMALCSLYLQILPRRSVFPSLVPS